MRRRQIIIGLAFTSILVLAISPSFAEEIAPGHILNPLGLQLNFTCAYNSENDEYLIAGTGFNSTSGTQPQAFVVHLSPAGTVSGVTYLSPSSLVQEHDIAYNPDRNEYIVVWRNDNLAGYATYLDGNGNEIGSEFLFSSSARSLRVDYSTVSNKYMVSFLSGSDVYYRIIDGDSTSGTPLPEPRRLVQLAAFGPAIAYGSTPDKFLITYHQEAGGGNTDNIYGRFVPGDGNPANMSGRLNIDTQPGLQQASHVAYASSVNRWMVVFSTWENGNRDAKAALVAANGSVVRTTWIATSPLWDVAQAVTYNSATDRFFVVWREEPYGFGRPVNPDTGQREPIVQFSNEDAFFEDACSRNLPAGPQYLGVWRNQLNDGIHAGIVGDLAPVPVDELPFGSFDTPNDGVTGVAGAIAVTGWALDDVEVTGVQIMRDPIAGEGTSLVFIGDAVFVEGARPDVETAYPGYPNNTRAGWGYMMLTNVLPNQGNGAYVIHAIARDTSGQEVTLGRKTITCNNGSATLPFGTIDTPTQGGTVSGTIQNWGWVLTPLPAPTTIPADGHTIRVFVDGVQVGSVGAGVSRGDITSLFPGYDTTTAVHYFNLNTTLYTNGVHQIWWIAEDSAGNADGIGSRFFSISN